MKQIATYQKLRGGYYTPEPIADFLAQWVVQRPNAYVLEPSCGDGILLYTATKTLIERGAAFSDIPELVQGVEFDPQEARKASERLATVNGLPSVPIHNQDFFSYCYAHLSQKRYFDAVIGNPPFIRYQNFPEEQRKFAFYFMQLAGLHPTRLTNAWVPFLVTSSLLLKETGRLAMVIPAELLQVNYAAELRYFLSNFYHSITIITFKKLVFEGIQQEVVLFLGEKSAGTHTGIRTIELEGVHELFTRGQDILQHTQLKEMDHSTEKWTMYFLDENELRLLRRLKEHEYLTRAGHVIDVDVGIVTGLNEFFVLSESQVEQYGLRPFTERLVGRSAQLSGAILTEQDWMDNVEKQFPAFLLHLPDVPYSQLPCELQSYIASGEARGLHTGYKCRIRNHWYVVPSVWTPQAFMLRQIHQFPRIVLNNSGATCTDTIHRVRLRNGTSAQTITAAFLNSLTFAFSEVVGRSYGGGVLELEPNEAEELPLPLKGAERLDVNEVDTLLRNNDIYSVLDITDRVLLQEGLGLSPEEIHQLRTIWGKLRDRRINRKPERVASSYKKNGVKQKVSNW